MLCLHIITFPALLFMTNFGTRKGTEGLIGKGRAQLLRITVHCALLAPN